MRVFLVLAVFAVLFLTPIHSAQEKEWGLYIYAVGDDKDKSGGDKLETWFWKVLKSLENSVVPQNTHVSIQLDRSYNLKLGEYGKQTSAIRYSYDAAGFHPLEDLGEINTGDPKTFYRFLKTSFREFPAKKIALIIMSHGSGIISWSGPTSIEDGGGYNDVFLPDTFTGYDGSGDSLTIFEFRKSLDVFKRRFPKADFEVLFFANCLNGMLEAANELSHRAKWMMAAPTLSYSLFDLSTLYPGFSGSSTMRKALYNSLYGYQQQARKHNLDAAFQLYKLDEVDSVVESLNEFSALWLPYAKDPRVGQWITSNKVERLYFDKYYAWLEDVSNLMLQSVSKLASREDYEQLEEAHAKLQKAMQSAIRIHVGSGNAKSRHSFSVFFPGKQDYLRYHDFYQKLEFSKNGHFPKVLESIITPSRATFEMIHGE